MATGKVTSYDFTTVNREDLANVVYNIDPTETPFVSAVGKTRATNTLHEWVTESLTAPRDNAAVYASDPSEANYTITTRSRLSNYIQLLDKLVVVGDEQRKSDPAGIRDELAHQVANGLLEIRRDLEYVCLAVNNAGAVGTASTAAHMKTVPAWITTNTQNGGGTSAFTETMLKTLLQDIWTKGGNPKMVCLNAAQQELANAFSGTATPYNDASELTVFSAVDVYVSSFGRVSFVPDRFSDDGTNHRVFVIDPEYWAIAQMDALKAQPLARTGHAEKRLLSWYVTVEARNEAASGMAYGLTS